MFINLRLPRKAMRSRDEVVHYPAILVHPWPTNLHTKFSSENGQHGFSHMCLALD